MTGTLRQVGAKKRRERAAERAAGREVRARDSVDFGDGDLVPSCRRCRITHFSADLVVHHICPSDRDRSIHDPTRMVLLCAGSPNDCHGRIHANPERSYVEGWLARDGAEGDLQEGL